VKRETKKLQDHGINLANRLSLSFIGLTALVLIIGLAIAYFNFRSQFRAQLQQRLEDIVSVAALQQNGDAFISVHSDQDPAYQTIRLQNLRIRSSDADLRFVYTMRYDNEGLYFVVDATNPGEAGASAFGDRYSSPGPVLAANYKTINKTLAETTFYTDEYGTFLSAYAPFYTSQGKFAGIIAADISAATVLTHERQVLMQFLLIFILLLPVVGLVGWLLGNQLSKPIASITTAAKHFSDGEFSYRPEIKTNFSEVHILRDTFFSMADQLLSLITNMEERIAERTSSLERRTAEIQAASLIARDTAAAPDIESMVDRAALLIMEKFGYYHTGIYLIDDNGENAILKGAGGEAGRLMMKRKYKVGIKERGVIGEVAQAGATRVILDIASESTYIKNPLLPYTRSEVAIPLKGTNRIIGILDIQSDKVNAFEHNSVSILQVVADQISISIEKTQLLQGLKDNAAALDQALKGTTSRTWRNFMERNRGLLGYQYDGVTIESLPEPSSDDIFEMQSTVTASIIKSETDKNSNILAVPIRLRGQTLGILNLRFQTAEISPETARLVEEAANRLALALENARLVQDAQRLATRERQINLISAQAQQSTNLDTLLQNTVRELGNALGMPKTFIQIGLVNSGSQKE
jgi:GAF domain-containing protein